MKRLIIKLVQWFILKMSIHQFIARQIEQDKIKTNLKKVSGVNFSLHHLAQIYNHQNNPLQISIGSRSQIKGNLLVFKYGGKITIGNDTYIGEDSRIWSGKNISIGNHVLISHQVNIIDSNSHELNSKERTERYDELISRGDWNREGNIISKEIIIEDDVWINFNAIILKGVTIGKGAVVAAGSVVTKDVAPYTMVAGNPAIFVKKVN
jgi:acetyltransferase-like isoleucine patch superfamily enzyme